MPRITIYSTSTCPICDNTKNLLKKWKIEYSEISLDQQPEEHKRFIELTQGARMVPQLLLDGKWIGGFTELTEMHMEGKLEELMS